LAGDLGETASVNYGSAGTQPACNHPPTGCKNRKKAVELTGIEPVTS
jgi:hypothetical protein